MPQQNQVGYLDDKLLAIYRNDYSYNNVTIIYNDHKACETAYLFSFLCLFLHVLFGVFTFYFVLLGHCPFLVSSKQRTNRTVSPYPIVNYLLTFNQNDLGDILI